MPEDIVLTHSNPDVQPWVVPVPEGRTAEDVAAAFEDAGWSLSKLTPADLAPEPAPVSEPVSDVPAEPATPDAAPADVENTPEGN